MALPYHLFGSEAMLAERCTMLIFKCTAIPSSAYPYSEFFEAAPAGGTIELTISDSSGRDPAGVLLSVDDTLVLADYLRETAMGLKK